MAKPRQADRVVEVAYAIAMAVNVIVSVVGYMMYGTEVSDEVCPLPSLGPSDHTIFLLSL